MTVYRLDLYIFNFPLHVVALSSQGTDPIQYAA
jgi:hypothetical protein